MCSYHLHTLAKHVSFESIFVIIHPIPSSRASFIAVYEHFRPSALLAMLHVVRFSHIVRSPKQPSHFQLAQEVVVSKALHHCVVPMHYRSISIRPSTRSNLGTHRLTTSTIFCDSTRALSPNLSKSLVLTEKSPTLATVIGFALAGSCSYTSSILGPCLLESSKRLN